MGAEERMSDPPPNRDRLIGSLVDGRFRILGVIGEGGMGKVYEALHEGLGRPVAIKVLAAAWASDDEAIQRFQREARTASNIGHRAIVDVSDLGRLDDGRPYLVMERLRGQSFADLLERYGRLRPHRVARLISEVASALDAVHARDIIHRDIKPENLVLLDEQGAPDSSMPDQVKLLDFGLAAFAMPSSETARLTRHGQMHGTPHYMAPESGDELPPDRRADVYSLATVAYELLTGFVPFDSRNPLQIITRKMHEEPPTMRERAGIDLGERVEKVIAKGLARIPDDRYTSAGQFARELSAAINDLSVEALAISGTHARVGDSAGRGAEFDTMEHALPPPGPTAATAIGSGSVQRWLRLNKRWAIGGGTLAAALLVVGALLLGRSEGKPARASKAAAHPTKVASRAPIAPEATPRPTADTPPPATTKAPPTTTKAPRPIARAVVPARPAERRARRAHAIAHHSAAKARKGADKAESAKPATATQAPASPSEPVPELAVTDRGKSKALAQQGTSALFQGRLPEAIRLFRDATLAFPGNVTAWRGLGIANERLGRRPEAIRAYLVYLRLAPNAADAMSVKDRLQSLQAKQ